MGEKVQATFTEDRLWHHVAGGLKRALRPAVLGAAALLVWVHAAPAGAGQAGQAGLVAAQPPALRIPNVRITATDQEGRSLPRARFAVVPAGGGATKWVPAGVEVYLVPGDYRITGLIEDSGYTAVSKAFTAPDRGQTSVNIEVQLRPQTGTPPATDTPGGGGFVGGGSALPPGLLVAPGIEGAVDEGAAGVTDAPVTFSDLSGHWARADIQVMAARHVVLGVGEGKFDPEREVTRAEFAAMVVRALGLEGEGEGSFTDVPAEAWYRKPVVVASAAGIVLGDGGRFRPLDPITRQEMAVMVARALKKSREAPASPPPDEEPLLKGFRDRSDLAAWAAGDVAFAVKEGILRGRAGGEFQPRVHTTRAEAATVLKRLLVGLGEL